MQVRPGQVVHRGKGFLAVGPERFHKSVAHLLEQGDRLSILARFPVRQGQVVQRGQGVRMVGPKVPLAKGGGRCRKAMARSYSPTPR